MALHILDSVPSTNQYCELLDLSQVEEFAVYAAHEQTAGIGQRGHGWAAEPRQNLTGSIILKPAFLPFADQFRLTQAVSLALTDFLRPLLGATSDQLRIKWPNDIYVGKHKICGILISTKIKSNAMDTAIVGIGLNINQMQFPDWVPNPVSLRQLTGVTCEPDTLWNGLIEALQVRYRQLQQPGAAGPIEQDYLAQLMNYRQRAAYIYRGATIHATIQGVNRYGHLQLTDDAGRTLSCQLQEIKLA